MWELINICTTSITIIINRIEQYMKILVVDDARDMRMIFQHILKKLGHDVDTAFDGEDAWSKLQKNEYQVILSDWVMPNLDGLELCKRVRSTSFEHYIYFILLTGMSSKQDLISGIKAGADDFATKPIDMEELEIRLRSAQRVLELEDSLAEKNKALVETHKRIQIDLVNAENTQISLLPKPIDSEFLKSSWLYKPAIYIGGDTFNYFYPSSELLVFFSIDISGHGISSAMLSMSLQVSLALKRSYYEKPITRENIPQIPELFASNVNKMLCNVKTDHYLTMVFGIIDFNEKDIHYVQAGHPHPFFYEKKTNSLSVLENNGYPVGLFEDIEYETQRFTFSEGDKFILFSDGINENTSAINNKILEGDNLYKHFDKIKEDSCESMVETISKNWFTPEQLKALPDDLSILIFEFK